MVQILDGKRISQQIRDAIKKSIAAVQVKPGLSVLLVGSDPASQTYVENKAKACREIGIRSEILRHPVNTKKEEILAKIETLNADPLTHGVLLQLPLPGSLHQHEQSILETISPEKDVDGLHPINIGRFMNNKYLSDSTVLLPCTPYGVIRLLQAYSVPIAGKNVVIIGRSNLVGKPLGMLFLAENATVTFCHSKTLDIKTITKQADIVVSAVGKPKFVDATFIKKGAVVIDVGFNYEETHLVGDVDFESVSPVASAITPVPGGVGPMTVAILMENVWKAYQRQTSNA
jgi:methylenetetrahydrofolate dehydrogenase (NADP+)/methenyltetrahydrofolate cyclohydrolase